jgi:colanic acid/amylovoran biosynthesis glycosyltransferase
MSVLCVAAQQRGVYCQTFIRAHIERLPATVLRELFISELPGQSIDRAPLIKRFLIDNSVEVTLGEFGDSGVDMMDACHATGVPLVVRFGGADAYCEAGKWLDVRPLYLPLFRMAAAIVAVSHDMERQLLSLGAPAEKLHYCPSGANTDLFWGADPSSAPPVFIAVGRFVDKKAPYLTIMAFAKVLRACPEARLIMAGEGYLLEICVRLAKALKVDEAITFKGACSHEEVALLMRSARCFVQHSVRAFHGDSEGTPNSVMEAGASGLPVISTRHAGIPDVVIENETGFLVEEGDVDAMAEYMIRVCLHPEEAARMGARASERVRREFSLNGSLATLWKIIESARAKR